MSFYPFNPNLSHKMQTDVESIKVVRSFIAKLVMTLLASSATAISAAVTLADGLTTTLTTEDITQPDFPRCLSITGNAATAVGNVVITGTNIADEEITETIVSTGAATVAGTKAFKTITSIVLPARGAASDTISVGTTNKIGLPYKLEMNTVLLAYLNGVKEGTAPVVAVDSANIEKNLITLNSALNGSEVVVYVLV